LCISDQIQEMTEAAVQKVKETELELRARMAGARAAQSVRRAGAKADRKVRRKATADNTRGKVAAGKARRKTGRRGWRSLSVNRA
jgi:hypothetical protein